MHHSLPLPPHGTGRLPGLVLLLLLAGATPALAVPTLQDGKPLTEKGLISVFSKAFRSKDGPTRAAAITELGDQSRQLEDEGASKRMVKELAKGLTDDDLEVRSAAVGQLAWGRYPDSVIAAYEDALDDLQKEVAKRITRPDDESKEYVQRGTRLFGDAAMALANYKDDRSADILASQLKNLRRNTSSNNLSTRLVGRTAAALLDIGTAEAVETAVKQMQVYNGQYQESASRALHQALAEFATRVGKAPPNWEMNVAVRWHDWFEDNEDLFPKKVGKLKVPPPERPYVEPSRNRERKDGGPERP
jgi:hypothetical protein